MRPSARIGLWLLAACAAVTLLYASLRVAERGRFASPYSSYGAGPDGTRALLMLARSLGHAPEPFARELSHLPRGTMLILSGCRGELLRKVTRPEREALARWVEDGGLLIVAGNADVLPEAAGLSIEQRASCRDDTEKTLLERALLPSPEAERGDRLLPAELTAQAAGPPLTHLLPFDVHEPWTLRAGHDTEATELLTSREGSLGLTSPFGRGRIVLLGIPEALTNHALSDGGGQVFARILRAFAPPGPVMFDEYHLGMGERRSVIGYLRDAGYSALMLQLVLSLLALLAAAAVRIAPAQKTAPRSFAHESFLLTLTRLYQRSQDHQGAVERLASHALARVGRHYHASDVGQDKLEVWFQTRGLFAVASYVRSLGEQGRQPLAAGETLTHRAQAIERDETAAIVVGDLVAGASHEAGRIPQEISSFFLRDSHPDSHGATPR